MDSWYFIAPALIVAFVAIAAAFYGIGLRSKNEASPKSETPIRRVDPAPQKPDLHLQMLGGNVFIPDKAHELTGINLTVHVWNTGAESPIPEWRLYVIPKGGAPVLAQFSDMPDQIALGGKTTSEIMRKENSIGLKTAKEPVGETLVTGDVLFYVKMSQDIVLNPETRIELSIKDVYGKETLATKTMRDWLQRK